MTYRVTYDESNKRSGYDDVRYAIYRGNVLVAHYLHNFGGDDERIIFPDGREEIDMVGPLPFLSGGGPKPLCLSIHAVKYLDSVFKK